MIRIYADWNAMDDHGRLLLNIARARRDLEAHAEAIEPGLRVLLDVQDEFEVAATLVFGGIWLAVPDEKTIRFLQSETEDR